MCNSELAPESIDEYIVAITWKVLPAVYHWNSDLKDNQISILFLGIDCLYIIIADLFQFLLFLRLENSHKIHKKDLPLVS